VESVDKIEVGHHCRGEVKGFLETSGSDLTNLEDGSVKERWCICG
jgi:hypothetical protein